MNKRLLLPFALAMATSAILPAQPPPPGPPPVAILRNLDLTEVQRQSVHAILERHRAAHLAVQQALAGPEKALMDAMDDPGITEPRLRELHAAVNEARFAALLEGRATMLEIQAVLTPAQQAKAKEERQKHQKPMDCQGPGTEEPGPPPRS